MLTGSPFELTRATTLHELRADWRAVIGGKGGHCPCCDRWGRVNKKSLNLTLVKTLVWMSEWRYHKNDGGWIHMPTEAPPFVKRSNQYSSLAGWGFIERQQKQTKIPSDVKHEGWWRITPHGMDFIEGKVKVPKQVLHYNQMFVGLAGPLVGPRDVDKQFSYSETMS